MYKKVLVITVILFSMLVPSLPAFAQGGDESFRVHLESILSKFKNYRFSEIAIYKIKDIKDIRNAIKTKEDESGNNTGQGGEVPECIKSGEKNVTTFVDNQLKEGKTINEVRREMLQRGMTIPPDLDCIYNYYASRSGPVVKQLRTVYAVTTRLKQDQIEPNVIIALIVSTEDNEFIDKNIDNPSPSNVYTYPELKNFELNPTEFRAKDMYELVLTAFRQGNVENKTLEAQGIGGMMQFGPKKYGVSNSLVNNRYEVTPQDVQKFVRVSEGQPNDMDLVRNEVVLSPDLIRWTRYDLDIQTYEDGTSDTVTFTSNVNLPKYGAELKYGIDDISLPSLWSERLALNAIWGGTKLGIILPTEGWAGLSQDAFKQTRKFSIGGVGVNGSVDFPMLLLPATGIFHISGGYVFGDAKAASYKNREKDPDSYEYSVGDDDYLIRANATVLYTFGISVDEDYILRFGLGASIYSAETWHYYAEKDPETKITELLFKNAKSETVGGITGKIDFMAKGLSTPIGGSIQYFDEGLYTNLWLQIPMIKNRLHFRLEAKGYFKAFTSTPHLWENQSVFIPMARIILNF